MSFQLKSYDFAQVALIVGGQQITGFADGTGITVDRAADDWTEVVGNDGEVTRAKSNNKLGTIEFVLQQSSDSNAYLSGLVASGLVVPAMVKDNSGQDLHLAEQAYLRRPATSEYGREVSTRTWTLVCANLQMFIGGNAV